MDLQDKVIIVAGGNGLIGKAIVAEARRLGATVVNADLTAGRDLSTGEWTFDIADESSILTLRDAVVQTYGRIDGWVNTAFPRTNDHRIAFDDMPAETWRKNVDLHLNGYVFCSRAALIQMKRQKSGSLVNIGSIYGIVGPDYAMYADGLEHLKNPPLYGAIKGAIVQLTRHLASLYGEFGIRVNTVSPGGIEDSHEKKFVDRYSRKTMLGRMGKPEDIAGPVAFLLSDAASYITGHNLIVDGGFTVM